jgi:hypothetical protein
MEYPPPPSGMNKQNQFNDELVSDHQPRKNRRRLRFFRELSEILDPIDFQTGTNLEMR